MFYRNDYRLVTSGLSREDKRRILDTDKEYALIAVTTPSDSPKLHIKWLSDSTEDGPKSDYEALFIVEGLSETLRIRNAYENIPIKE